MEHLIWIYYSLLAALTINLASARFCEGGNHKCLPPKECCAQGCCYLYSPPSAPRSSQPADNVLNLFFINHWYFWLFLFAIVIAFLLFFSLWKKRHALFCGGWSSSSSHRTPSNSGTDSAGSCFAPPHYSRCSSFYHAPPPYTEVTSKPDLYPLVFSYTNEASKNGNNRTNYLMVQCFDNYIVRPIGSLSATSTVDSLSSSFICTANEANEMIPPPYSSAASPDDVSIWLQNYAIKRSASQQGCMNAANYFPVDLQHATRNFPSTNRPMSVPNTNQNHINAHHQFRASESANFANLVDGESRIMVHQSQIPTSSNSTSTMATTHTGSSGKTFGSRGRYQNTMSDDDDDYQPATSGNDLSIANVASGVSFDTCNQGPSLSQGSPNETMMSLSAAMMDKISYSRQTNDHTKLNMIQKQLEKCCEMIHQQQQQIQQTRSHFNVTTNFDCGSPTSNIEKTMSDNAIMGLSYMNSNPGSTVSSLANLNSPLASPPQATSPTQEVKDLFDQIRQLKDTNFSDNELNNEISYNDLQCGPSTDVHAPLKSLLKRPTTLNSERRFFNMKHRATYLPIVSNALTSPSGFNSNRKLRSPISKNSAGVFMAKSRGLRNNSGWTSKSAPTTPGTLLPSNFLNDDSPLLYEQDEDADADQNC